MVFARVVHRDTEPLPHGFHVHILLATMILISPVACSNDETDSLLLLVNPRCRLAFGGIGVAEYHVIFLHVHLR
jgi:hypothetical protein